jgi:uncharacterized protein (DUF2236 family)
MSTTSPKPAAKALKQAIPAPAAPVAEYRMPSEVADWIKRAEARLTFMATQVQDLKDENAKLRRANKVMESRVMGQSQE